MSAAHAPVAPAHPGGFAASGGGGNDDGDDPSRRKRLKPTHSVDEPDTFDAEQEEEDEKEEEERDAGGENPLPPPPRRRKRRSDLAAGPQQCNVCNKMFGSIKALHGHMRSHPFRKWRGTVPPSMQQGAEQEVAESLLQLAGQGDAAAPRKRRFICSSCNREFPTRQALGGHRASHKNQKGCYEKAKEAREYGPRVGRQRPKRKKNKEAGQSGTVPETDALAMGAALQVALPPPPLPPLPAAPPASSVPPPPATGEKMTTGGRRRLDLNLAPPPSSDEASGGGNGGGSSTSSGKGGEDGNKDA